MITSNVFSGAGILMSTKKENVFFDGYVLLTTSVNTYSLIFFWILWSLSRAPLS